MHSNYQQLSFIFLLAVVLFNGTPAYSFDSEQQVELTKRDKLIAANMLGITLVTTWGIRYWDYGSSKPYFEEDNWFQQDSVHGGADKLGHVYSAYISSHILSHYYRKWGYTHEQAALYGAASGLGILTFSEMGDSISSHGFSVEDWVMDLIGSVTAYGLYRYPRLQDYVDIRLQYVPTFEEDDRSSDYEGMTYLVAFKLGGIKSLPLSALKYLEFHVGYYARGYEFLEPNPSRNVYAAFGVNLSELFKLNSKLKQFSKVFNYIQVPYTYRKFSYDLN